MDSANWIIGLDVGDVRVGVALLSLAVGIPLPHNTFLRAKGQAEREIVKLCKDRNVNMLVVGLPLSEDGSENLQCEKIRNFIRRLQNRIGVTVEYVDEYLSSDEAQQRLQMLRFDAEKIDAQAAAIILERYLGKGR